jgi:hypothetical protein
MGHAASLPAQARNTVPRLAPGAHRPRPIQPRSGIMART